MMNKIGLAIICVSMFFLASCKKKVREELQILIQNKTDTHMEVTLFPVVETTPTVYPVCKGCGANMNSKFILPPHDGSETIYCDCERMVFSTNDLNIEPYALVRAAFDSIRICLPDKDSVIIRFTPEKVTGYSENIFAENAAWDFRIVEYNLYTSVKNYHKDYCYGFIISEDNITIE